MTLTTNILEEVHGLSFFAILFGSKHLTHVSYQSVFSFGLSSICGAGTACLCKLTGNGVELNKTTAKKCWPLLKVPITQLHLFKNSAIYKYKLHTLLHF
jgi:hypothetical protein